MDRPQYQTAPHVGTIGLELAHFPFWLDGGLGLVRKWYGRSSTSQLTQFVYNFQAILTGEWCSAEIRFRGNRQVTLVRLTLREGGPHPDWLSQFTWSLGRAANTVELELDDRLARIEDVLSLLSTHLSAHRLDINFFARRDVQFARGMEVLPLDAEMNLYRALTVSLAKIR